MSDSLQQLRAKISRARQLGTIVHAMKALATLRISQFEQAVQSLGRYLENVELGLSVCLRSGPMMVDGAARSSDAVAVIFGSDQGLVGRFNESIREYAESVLERHGKSVPESRGQSVQLWVVGERLAGGFADHGRPCERVLEVPSSVAAISPLVASVLEQLERARSRSPSLAVYLLFNRFEGGASFTPVCERLLPFDARWERRFTQVAWPTHNLPEPVGKTEGLLSALIREYLFVSLFRACAESISSENASRRAAMQRAERNIDSLVESLGLAYNGVRQSAIDEELFDVVAGFEALPGRPAA